MKKRAEIGILSAIIAFVLLIVLTPALNVFGAYERVNSYKTSITDALYSINTVNLINNYDDIKYSYADNSFKFDEEYKEKSIEAIVEHLGLTYQDSSYRNEDKTIYLSDLDLMYDESTYTLSLKYNIKSRFKVIGFSSSINVSQTAKCSVLTKY